MNLWSKELVHTFEFLLVGPLYWKRDMVKMDRQSRQGQASRDYKRIFKMNYFHGLSHADLITLPAKCRAARLLCSCASL